MTSRKTCNGAWRLSESAEDHLGRIYTLVEAKGYSRVTDLAAALHLSTSTVSNMVRRLAKRGFVNYERYRGFTLRPAGKRVALEVKVRRQTLAELLEMLGLSPDTVDHEVEDLEHHLRPATLRRISQLVSFWRQHPAHLEAFARFAGGH